MIGYENNGKFFLEAVPYALREIPKSCGFRWDKKAKLWIAPTNIITAMAVMSVSKSSDNMIGIESWYENAFDFSGSPAIEFANLKTKPREYQAIGASRLVNLKRFGIFFDMATGKTFTALMAASYLHRERDVEKVLVICPISLFSTWVDEMHVHLGVRKEKVHVLWGEKTKREKAVKAFAKAKALKRHPVFAVTSWDSVHSIKDALIDIASDMVVGDESSFIKSRNARRTKSAIAVADSAQYVAALTGTPYISGAQDIWSQLRFISLQYAGASFWRFANRYIEFDRSPWRKPIGVRDDNKEELRKLIASVSMTVKKDEVIDLPPKTHQQRVVSPKGAQGSAMKKLVKEFYVEVEAARSKKTGTESHMILVKNALVKALKIQQISCGWTKNEEGEVIFFKDNPKRDAFLEILEESRGHQVVVFSRFVQDLVNADEYAKKQGLRPVLYHGLLSAKKAEANYQAFRDRQADVFLCQVQKGGFGINLTVADVCVYFNNWWSTGVRDQSEDRLHRPGQESSVTYIDLVMDGGVDASIIEAIRCNKSLSQYLFGVEVNDE